MPARTLVVVNPRSRGGATQRQFASLEPRLRDSLGAFEVEWTRAPRDAERIAREGVRAGIERGFTDKAVLFNAASHVAHCCRGELALLDAHAIALDAVREALREVRA